MSYTRLLLLFPLLASTVIPASAAVLPQGVQFFQHGIASGDPLPDRVVLWTRITPSDADQPGVVPSGAPDVSVSWDVATDDQFQTIVKSGNATSRASADYTVKIDPGGLSPATWYYFRFTYEGTQSPTGRTRTAPADASAANVRFGHCSCANFEAGPFAAYRYMAQRDDLDFILHGGDYVYEYKEGEYPEGGPNTGRSHEPKVEMTTRAGYRQRHAQYKRDLDLQYLHSRYPFICTWDDHEISDDAYSAGATNHTEGTEGTWSQRQRDAYEVYFEWMPVRPILPGTTPPSIYRTSRYGSLVELITLDLRQYREKPPGQGEVTLYPNRKHMGDAQKNWFLDKLSASTATWKLINNSVMISAVDVPAASVDTTALIAAFASKGQSAPSATALTPGQPYNTDQWDGYPNERQLVLDHLENNNINNVAFLTGDIHSLWASEVPYNKATYRTAPRAVAVEFVCSSVTSDNLNEIAKQPDTPRAESTIAVENGFKIQNPWIKDIELDSHGFSVVDVNASRIRADWYFISDRRARNPSLRFYRGYEAAAWNLGSTTGPAAVVTETTTRLSPR